MATFLSLPIFKEIILPFLLVFSVIFAILEKARILGEEKRRINAIVSLVIALLVVAFSNATKIIVTLMPFLAVFTIVILVFMILYGFVAAGKEGADFSKFKIPFGIIIGIGLIVAVLVATDYWGIIVDWFKGGNSSSLTSSIIFIGVIIAAIAIVLSGKGKEGKS